MRRWAAAMAAVVLLANLAGAFHAAFVRHETCPEHGELIEVRGDRPDASIPAAETERDAAYRSAPGAGYGHTHQHCSLCLASQHRAAISVTVAPSTVGPEPSEPAALATDGELADGIPIYLIAPKNSPPRPLSTGLTSASSADQDDDGRVALG